MKPVIERMLAYPTVDLISLSLLHKNTFHCWLTHTGEKHKLPITQFHSAIKRLLKDQDTAEIYTNRLQLLVEGKGSEQLEEFLNMHPEVETFLIDHFHTIENAALDFIVDECVTELDKNIDYLNVARKVAAQPKAPPLSGVKIAPPPPKAVSESPPKSLRIQYVATDQLMDFIGKVEKIPFSMNHLLALCDRLEKLKRKENLNYLLKLYALLAVDLHNVDIVCSKYQHFNFKYDAPENYRFIQECVKLQLPLLLLCSKDLLQKFCCTLMKFSQRSYYQEYFVGLDETPEEILASKKQLYECWQAIYQSLLSDESLKTNGDVLKLVANLEVFLVDIRPVVSDENLPATQPVDDFATQSDSTPSSQDVPPAEENETLKEIQVRPVLPRTYSESDFRRSRLARQHSAPESDWNRHFSIYSTNNKRSVLRTSDTDPIVSEAKRTDFRQS